MKVAIMGAGLSGLACAKILEEHGVSVEIFEKRHRVGERFPNMEAVIQLMHRPLADPLVYLNKKFNINLTPAGVTHTIEIHSRRNKAVLSGNNIGYTSIRGHDERSWENQLHRQIKSKIYFNSTLTWQELIKDYDRVIIATGDPTISRELGIWKSDVEVFIKGCKVKGNFNIGTTKIWLNQDLSKQGYVYFAPFDTKEATFCIAATPSSPDEIDHLWSNTINALQFTPLPKSEFKLEEFKIGRVNTRQVGKMLITGSAGGFIDPFMGFGQIPSLLSGVYAAISILTNKNYNKLTAWFDKQYSDCLTVRDWLSNFQNDDFDKLVYLLNMPYISKIIASSSLPIINMAAKMLRAKKKLKRLIR